jgi:hypothetical protein
MVEPRRGKRDKLVSFYDMPPNKVLLVDAHMLNLSEEKMRNIMWTVHEELQRIHEDSVRRRMGDML